MVGMKKKMPRPHGRVFSSCMTVLKSSCLRPPSPWPEKGGWLANCNAKNKNRHPALGRYIKKNIIFLVSATADTSAWIGTAMAVVRNRVATSKHA